MAHPVSHAVCPLGLCKAAVFFKTTVLQKHQWTSPRGMAAWPHRDTHDSLLGVAEFAPGQHGVPQVPGLAMLKRAVTFPAGSLRPGTVMVFAEEPPVHHRRALVRCLPSWLVSCSTFVNLGHFCFSSNCVSDMSCTQKGSVPLPLEHHQ